MTQHFLLPAAARLLSRAKVMRMSDRDAENVVRSPAMAADGPQTGVPAVWLRDLLRLPTLAE